MTTNTQLAAFNYLPNKNSNVKTISTPYTITAADNGAILNLIAGASFAGPALPASTYLSLAASLGAGFTITFLNKTGATTVLRSTYPTDTIDGSQFYLLSPGAVITFTITNSATTGQPSNWQIISVSGSGTGTASTLLGSGAVASGTKSTAIMSGIATSSGSIAIGAYFLIGDPTASAIDAIAIGDGASATSTYSTAIGVNSGVTASKTVTGSGAMALGGSYASGVDSFAAGIANNTSTYGAQGANSIAIGKQAKATVAQGVAIGDRATAASGGQAVAIGQLATASGTSSISIAGYLTDASGIASIAMGSNYYVGTPTASGGSSIAIGDGSNSSQKYSVAFGVASVSAVYGKYAYAGGLIAAAGDSQYGLINLRGATTDATAKVLTSDNLAASTINQVILTNNQAMAIRGQVAVRRSVTQADQAALVEFTCLIRRGTTAASTAIVGTPTITVLATDITSLPAAPVALTADTTNGGLKIEVTGVAATNLRWVAVVTSAEVIYA